MSVVCLFGLDSMSAVVPLLPGALCTAGNEVVKVMFIVKMRCLTFYLLQYYITGVSVTLLKPLCAF